MVRFCVATKQYK